MCIANDSVTQQTLNLTQYSEANVALASDMDLYDCFRVGSLASVLNLSLTPFLQEEDVFPSNIPMALARLCPQVEVEGGGVFFSLISLTLAGKLITLAW